MARFLRWLLYVQSLLIGAAGIALAARPELWDIAVGHVEAYYAGDLLIAGRVLAGAFGALQLLTLLALLLRWYNQHRFSREVSYNTEYGQVAVSLLAIEEALSRAVENEPGVRKVSIKVREDRVRRCILVTAALTLWDVDNISEQNRRCQDLLRKRFSELMPEKTAVQIELTVHRLKQRQPERGGEGVDSTAMRRRRTTVGDGPSGLEALSLTPGLAMTRGQTDNHAGAALLAEARQREQRRHDGGSSAGVYESPEEDPASPEPGETAAAVEAVRRMQEAAKRGITVATEAEAEESRQVAKQITASFRYDSDAGINVDRPLEASTVIPRDESNQRDTQPRAATNAITDDGHEQFDDLYFGPTYPVITDEEPDYSGQALPADKPPSDGDER